jgi:hypothetical protein
VITREPLLALGFTIIADLFASLPNFRHVAKNPEHEDKLAWGIGWLSAVLVLFAISEWNLASSSWAVYYFLNMSLIFYLLSRDIYKRASRPR